MTNEDDPVSHVEYKEVCHQEKWCIMKIVPVDIGKSDDERVSDGEEIKTEAPPPETPHKKVRNKKDFKIRTRKGKAKSTLKDMSFHGEVSGHTKNAAAVERRKRIDRILSGSD